MRSVLLLAAHFPPLGGAAVQRNLQLARHLAGAGYRPVVLARAGARDDFRWTPKDAALVEGLPPNAIRRLPSDEPSIGTPRLRRWLRIPSPWERWWKERALEAATDAAADVDIVHASLAPYMTGGAAIAIAQRLRKPLVLDLEDPWALDDMMEYTTGLHRRLDLRQMRRVLAAADAVVMNTSEARLRVLAAFPELVPDRVAAIPNAFDPVDFAGPAPEPSRGGCFRIVHTGSLHADRGLGQRATGRARRLLGGSSPDVDFLPRSHVHLLAAVETAVGAHPELGGIIEVHLAGVFTVEDRDVASRYPFVRLHEFLPHEQTVALMRSADLLFLPLYDLPPGRRAGIVPHKTYEYIGSGRPILAAVPDGDARDLLARSGAAVLCRPSDVEAMAAALLADVKAWAGGRPSRAPSAEAVAECSAGRLVADLVAVYDQLLLLGAERRTERAPAARPPAQPT